MIFIRNNDISQDDLDVGVMVVDGDQANQSSAHVNSQTDMVQNSSTAENAYRGKAIFL